MDKKTKIGTMLAGIGVTTAIVGGVALSGGQPLKVQPIPKKCIGEELTIEKETVCMDKGSYNLIKSTLKTNKLNDSPLYLWTDVGRLHLDIINHEMKKQNKKIRPKNAADAAEIFQMGNDIL